MEYTCQCNFCPEKHQMFYRVDVDSVCLAYRHFRSDGSSKVGFTKLVMGLPIETVYTREYRRRERRREMIESGTWHPKIEPEKKWVRYGDYLKSEHWQSKRAECLEKKNNHCTVCLSKEYLHVHHKTYTNQNGNTILGRERLKDLSILCNKCHSSWHAHHKIKDRLNSRTVLRLRKLINDLGISRQKAFELSLYPKVCDALIEQQNFVNRYKHRHKLNIKNSSTLAVQSLGSTADRVTDRPTMIS